jgi:hypothetical protein
VRSYSSAPPRDPNLRTIRELHGREMTTPNAGRGFEVFSRRPPSPLTPGPPESGDIKYPRSVGRSLDELQAEGRQDDRRTAVSILRPAFFGSTRKTVVSLGLPSMTTGQ